ncbi:hypothetical protein MKW92_010946 [Papaver armeniacum]|nr:hypothetical protein MKW92_010946 [Papaver armeniacum]
MNSFHLHLIFIIFFFFFTQFLVVAAHGCHENERDALLNFKSSLRVYPSNLLSSWQDSHTHRNCCSWHGVECSHESFHVISINLRDKNRENYLNNGYDMLSSPPPPNASLKGSHIPHQFNNLKKLTYLNLSLTSLSGSITTQFNNLSSLRFLDLSCLYNPDDAPYAIFSYSNSCLKSPSLNWVRGLHNLKGHWSLLV